MFYILYLIIGIFWGCFAVKMQKKFYPNISRTPDLALTCAVNAVIWPISVIFAIYRYITKNGWAKYL